MMRALRNDHWVADRPQATHWRKATCKEVNCPQGLQGWLTVVDVSTTLGQAQEVYIRRSSGRRFTEKQYGTVIEFTFYPGQDCFREHRVPLDRGPILTRGGHIQEFDQWIDGWNENAYQIHKLMTGRG